MDAHQSDRGLLSDPRGLRHTGSGACTGSGAGHPRAYHSGAHALSVRILDSERAARYDRHSDGGALAAAHLIGLVNRNERLGTDRIEIRGRVIQPSGSGGR